jgi:ribosomal protein S12 methylthiotransferase
MRGWLESDGCTFVDSAEAADVILINTCGFIREAVEESVDTILEAAAHRASGRCERLVVCGCLVQRYGDELADSLPEVDCFVGCSELDRIKELFSDSSDRRVFLSQKTSFLPDGPLHRTPSLGPHTAYLKVSEGCDRSCAFCTVPAIRGPQRSRPVDDLVAEARGLMRRGVLEMNLVAQDLSAYGKDLGGSASLRRLISRLTSELDELLWLRCLYLYPSAVTEKLVDVLAGSPSVAPYLDLPLQHVTDRVLAAMDRGYGSRTANRLMERVRERWPEAHVRTTLLVGHPGEGREDFEEVKRFVSRWQLDHLGVFAFSPEEGTRAVAMDHPSLETADRRREEIMAIQRGISRERLADMVGRRVEVLIDGPSSESDHMYVGRHSGQAVEIDGVVYVTGDERAEDGVARLSPGDVVTVRIDETGDYDLAGMVV